MHQEFNQTPPKWLPTEAIRAATGLADRVKELSRAEAGVPMAIAYFQPVTRGEISEMFGREVLAMPAAAQEQKAEADLGLEPVKGTEELWYLLTALDALIFCLAVAVIKDPAVIVQARREIQPYSSQLSDPKAQEAFNAALKSSDGQARVEQNKTAIFNAAKEIDALLTDVVSPPVRDSLVQAFSRSSTLLIARAADSQSWWCRVYAFRKVRC